MQLKVVVDNYPKNLLKDEYLIKEKPIVDLTRCQDLLKEWGVEDLTIKRLNVFVVFYYFLLAAGMYFGRSVSDEYKHLVAIDPAYPYHPPKLAKCPDFIVINTTLIHELRHLYWNIVEPGYCIADAARVYPNSFRPQPYYVRSAEQRRIKREEEDCEKIEKEYADFLILRERNTITHQA